MYVTESSALTINVGYLAKATVETIFKIFSYAAVGGSDSNTLRVIATELDHSNILGLGCKKPQQPKSILVQEGKCKQKISIFLLY